VAIEAPGTPERDAFGALARVLLTGNPTLFVD
jgi:hypothetical protein